MNVRRLFQFRLPTLLVAVAVVCGLLVANTRPHGDTLLGHVSSDEPGIWPGLWVSGEEFGWPWTYRVKPYDHWPAIAQDAFSVFDHSSLAANVAVGLLVLALAMISTEQILRGISRLKRQSTLS
jgi:hypothetical protein